MEGKSVKNNSSIDELIKELTDQNTHTSPNKNVERIRKRAIEEIREAGVESLSDIFGKKHKKSISGYKILNLTGVPEVHTLDGIQNDDLEIGGKKIIGKIKICNENIVKWIDPKIQEKGVIFCDLLSAMKDHAEEVNHVFNNYQLKHNTLISNLAIGQSKHGSMLYVPNGVQPVGTFVIEIEVSHSRSLIPIHLVSSIGESASSSLVIQIKSTNNNKNRSILVIQNDLILAENSHLMVFQNQRIGEKLALFISEHIFENSDADFSSFTLDQGSAITDRLLNTELLGEGGSANITGLYNSQNGQQFYYDTQQNHIASYTKSDLLFKGVLGKNAYSSWKGNILVTKKATGADSYQANENLLIDPSAKAKSIPGLEISTDDVRCSHGVTIGNIDKNQMFYLQSRGINQAEAKKIIIEGFLSSAVKRIADLRFEEFVLNSIEK